MYVDFGDRERTKAVQQNLRWTPAGTLACEDCGAEATGDGRDAPYVIEHAEECQFASAAMPPRPPGRHRAPV